MIVDFLYWLLGILEYLAVGVVIGLPLLTMEYNREYLLGDLFRDDDGKLLDKEVLWITPVYISIWSAILVCFIIIIIYRFFSKNVIIKKLKINFSNGYKIVIQFL